jgi:hypothetical protein
MYFSGHRWYRKAKSGNLVLTNPYWSDFKYSKIVSNLVSFTDFLTIDKMFRSPEFLIRYEPLNVDFEKICRKIKFPVKFNSLESRSQSAGSLKQKMAVLSNLDLKKWTKPAFAQDMSLFGYA